ncbi:SDR family oxidoreductase [Streptomyces sp. GC420]|uniref:SDR family oxidoreductase n=1 Tax=Streptomyces sp. GC420 TaxID=2697568 RepID=UPI0014150177|nr:NAD(P)H-binding protein [Streptomyces sp. GC420]NBM17550.1 NAD(P)H-binding protein [Streptomyces sp. GC420]
MRTLTIAIAGGTGTLGRHITEELRSRGHRVRVLSRRSPEHRVDLTTGEGLADALEGCDVVVDAVNNPSAKGAARTLVEGSRRLLAAEEAAGVAHHVCVSIVGCDAAPTGYYRVKTEQERTVRGGPVPWTVVRATQFHELVGTVFGAAGKWRLLPVPRARLQPIAAADAARAVADAAEAPARNGFVQVAGPEITSLRALAGTWRTVTGRRALLVPIPVPGALGRALRAGALTAERPDARGTVTFGEWLAQRQGERVHT